MSQVFISYRRLDSRHFTYRLQDRLERSIEFDSVFVDEHMHAGTEYPSEIRKQLANSEIVIVVIGGSWLRNLERQRKDWVHEEIQQALKSKIPIIPILIDDAAVPSEDSLPDSIRDLLRFQFHHFHRPGSFENDALGLLKAIRNSVSKNYGWKSIELGSLGRDYSPTEAFDINNNGDVCGSTFTVNGFRRAFIWQFDEHQMFELGTIGCNESEARAINDSSFVTGWSEDAANRRCVFFMDTKGYLSADRANNGMIDVGLPPGFSTHATSINNNNEVVGVYGDVYSAVPRRGFHWKPESKFSIIPPLDGYEHSVAHDINDSGIIAGSSYDTSKRSWHACTFERNSENSSFVGRDYKLRNHFNTCCSDFFALTNQGNSAGRSRRPPDSQRVDQGVIVRANGEIDRISWPYNAGGRFHDINSDDHTVGYIEQVEAPHGRRPVIWDGKRFVTLDYRTVNGLEENEVLTEAVAINDSGIILCRGKSNGTMRSFILIPSNQ